MSGKSATMGGGGSVGPGGRTRRKTSEDHKPVLTVAKCKEHIMDMLVSTGKRDLLKRLISNRLTMSGWTYSMRNSYVNHIKLNGVDDVSVSQMIAEYIPIGLQTFPVSVRNETKALLEDFASQYISIDESVTPPPETDTNYSHLDSVFHYQSKEVKPDPGLGVNVTMPEVDYSHSRSPSPDVSIPRPLTPQPPIPILRPEKVAEPVIKEEPIEEDEEELSDVEDEDDEEEDRNDDDEEELMDV